MSSRVQKKAPPGRRRPRSGPSSWPPSAGAGCCSPAARCSSWSWWWWPSSWSGSTGGGTSTPAAAASGTASAAVVDALKTVPANVLDEVGKGQASNAPKQITAPALTQDGKPRLLYVGAEYCPYCAAERWPITVALSRFGAFTNLGSTASSSEDVYPSTPTLSFHGATYTSQYLSFTGVETTTNKRQGNSYEPLDSLTSADNAIVTKYNAPPYISGQGGAIPFIDIGGTFVSAGASYSPQLLAGKTHEQVAAALKNPSDPIAQAVDGSANVFTAAICQVTGGKPGNVCGSAGVKAAAASLGK